jgi:hypothetical protein
MIGGNPFPDELWNPSPGQIQRERLEDRLAREAVGLPHDASDWALARSRVTHLIMAIYRTVR